MPYAFSTLIVTLLFERIAIGWSFHAVSPAGSSGAWKFERLTSFWPLKGSCMNVIEGTVRWMRRIFVAALICSSSFALASSVVLPSSTRLWRL